MQNRRRFILFIVIGVLIFALFRTMQDKTMRIVEYLALMENRINHQIYMLEQSIDDIYDNINTHLEEQASLLTGTDWSYGEVDIQAGTVELNYFVTPKSYHPETTTATLVCDGVEYPMALEGSAFCTTFPISLFDNTVIDRVLLTDGGAIQTQAINYTFNPRYELLPTVYAYSDFDSFSSFDVDEDDDKYTWTQSHFVDISVHNNGIEDLEVMSIELIEYLDGTEVARTTIPLVQNALDVIDSHSSAVPVSPADPTEYPKHFYYQWEDTHELFPGQSFELYIEVTDNLGLHHQALLSRIIWDNNGLFEEWYDWLGLDASIYNESGELLYESEKFY